MAVLTTMSSTVSTAVSATLLTTVSMLNSRTTVTMTVIPLSVPMTIEMTVPATVNDADLVTASSRRSAASTLSCVHSVVYITLALVSCDAFRTVICPT